MSPLAYLNGRFIPAAEAAISVEDAGFVLGVTVAEQLRTVGGRLLALPQHLDRLQKSLSIVGIELDISVAELAAIAERLASDNHRQLVDGDDLGLSVFVTPGRYATFSAGGADSPTIGMHTYPLPFRMWADKYELGQMLVTTDVRQVPADCWPPELKCRSRMHYFLADRAARAIDPQARAVLQDTDGFITETSTANVLTYNTCEGLVSPPACDILPGISLSLTRKLAGDCGIPVTERRLTPDDLASADEVLLTSTPSCLLPATRFNGQSIGGGQPGPIYLRLLAAWNALAQIDLAAQAVRFKGR